MNKLLLILFTMFLATFALAKEPVVITEKDSPTVPELQVNSAKAQADSVAVADLPTAKPIDIQASKQELLQNQPLTELLLNRAIESGQMGAVVDCLRFTKLSPSKTCF